ncbi:MAG: CBS domain-containing protein [Chitinophagales bacterium]|nr:CBS domain-containing protein [Chitinophagales bacterium]
MPTTTPIEQIMTGNVIYANQFHPFSQVIELFSQYNLHHLPIVDGKNKVIGIVSTNDVMKIFIADKFKGRTIDTNTLDAAVDMKDLMTEHPQTIGADEPVAAAAAVFRQRKFQSLPVVNSNGELVGIITIKDVLDFYVKKLDE